MEKECYRGLTWNESLTQEKIKEIEDSFGPLKKTLSGLAGLVRQAYCQPRKPEPGSSTIDCTHHNIEYDKDSFLNVPPESYGLVIRTLASTKICRDQIEMVVGAQQAKKFYFEVIRAIQGLDLNPGFLFDDKIEFEGKNAVEGIAQLLEKWERIIYTKMGTTQGTAPAKRVGIIKRIIGWIFEKTIHLIGVIIVTTIGSLIAIVLIDILGEFGWIEKIKTIYNILTSK